MVLGADRSRLSKRHGAMSSTAYRDMGYLPDAVLNYLVRLGWSLGDEEFFTREDLIEKFNIDNTGKAAGIFNPEKLTALNADHIKAAPPEKLAPHLLPFLKEKGYPAENDQYLHEIIPTLSARSKTLIEMADGAAFYYQDDIEFEEKAAKKFLKANVLEPFAMLKEKFAAMDDFGQEIQEAVFKEIMEKFELKFGKIAQPLRVALTGKTVSPGIFEIIEVLGKDRVLPRLEKAVAYMKERTAA